MSSDSRFYHRLHHSSLNFQQCLVSLTSGLLQHAKLTREYPTSFKHIFGQDGLILPRRIEDQNKALKLPDFSEVFENPGKFSQVSAYVKSENKSPIVLSDFPVLQMIIKKPVEMKKQKLGNINHINEENEACQDDEIMRQSEEQNLNTSVSNTNNRSSMRSSVSYYRGNSVHINSFATVTYIISYRLSHKFTLRFKDLAIMIPTSASLDYFKSTLFAKVFRKTKFKENDYKQIFIEKQRDLIPLIDKRQLVRSRTNYLMICDSSEKETVIEKPILLKKRNKPDIGISELTFKQMAKVEKRYTLKFLNTLANIKSKHEGI